MRILFIGIDANRTDILKNIEPASQLAQCFFLENNSPGDIRDPYVHSLGNVLFWNNYSDAFQLLETIRPDKIVYILLDNYYHFALFFAAKQSGIPVCYMDHGIRYENELELMQYIDKGKQTAILAHIRKSSFFSFVSLFKNTFYKKTLDQLHISAREIAKKVFIGRSQSLYTDFMLQYGKYMQPDHLIIFSPETFGFYKHFFSLPDSYNNYTFTGIPSLDYFPRKGSYVQNTCKGILFIDQPLHEQNVLGWTKAHKMNFWEQFISVATKNGYKIFIKPHPLSAPIYEQLNSLHAETVVMVEEITSELIKTQINTAASFNSTLLLGFCGMESINTLCMEMHPLKGLPDFSKGITRYYVAARVSTFAMLDEVLKNPGIELERKKRHVPYFIKNVLHSFDGKAVSRITKALTE